MLGGAGGTRARLRGHGRAAPGPPRAPRRTHALSTSSRTFHMFNMEPTSRRPARSRSLRRRPQEAPLAALRPPPPPPSRGRGAAPGNEGSGGPAGCWEMKFRGREGMGAGFAGRREGCREW